MLRAEETGAARFADLAEIDLIGRVPECRRLERLLDEARAGRGGVLVVSGEPGVGKSALLTYAANTAVDFGVAQTLGVQAEMELPYAAVQQLCSQRLELLPNLPRPQRQALGVVLGLRSGPAPNPYLVGLALLGLLSEGAEEQPLLMLVDDAQWLDRASMQVLGFVARRLLAEKIALVLAGRLPDGSLSDLPALHVEPLTSRDSRALLNSVLPAPLDDGVLERIIVETRGNPLALLELPRGLTPAQLAGGFGLLPLAVPTAARIEESFGRRLAALSAHERSLLLLAAADPVGDPTLLWKAAHRLGIPESTGSDVESKGWLTFASHVAFRHPLVRSAVYGSATAADRREAHRALAEATDPKTDPDRRAWHRAHAASAPDEDVAGDLERSADRARARGGFAAEAAFLERAAALTSDARKRAQRVLAAAGAKRDAGDLDAALALLAGLQTGALDGLGDARAELLRARIALEQRRGTDAGTLFLSAARRFEPVDVGLARETYLEVLGGVVTSDVDVPGGAAVVAASARAAPAATAPAGLVDVLVDGFAVRFTDGYQAAAPVFQRALGLLLATDTAGERPGVPISLSSARNGNVVALEMWNETAMHELADRGVRAARVAGALGHLQYALSFSARTHMLAGDLSAAALALDEARVLAEVTGNPALVNAPMVLAAWQGDERLASELIEANSEEATSRRWSSNNYARSVLFNGLGQYDLAHAAAWETFRTDPMGYGPLLVPELAEAASRIGDRASLTQALEWLVERTSVIRSRWADGVESRVRALLDDGKDPEAHYHASIEHLSHTGLRLEVARSHLLYGEWLRRERRRLDARSHLRTALEDFTNMGTESFARRAERELLATGERARKRSPETLDELTPQEAQIARMAADGLTNREIATQLFISPSTVEYHLGKAFRKLDVKSRTQIGRKV
jgi:DNA-binding CsgD family transcriptional regulator